MARALWIAVLLMAASIALAQTPPLNDPTFRVNVDLVQVDAVVTDSKGNQVRDLGPRLIRLPDFNRKGMMLTSVILSPDEAAGDFPPGSQVDFLCEVLGARQVESGRLRVEMEIRLYRGGAKVFNSTRLPAELHTVEGRDLMLGHVWLPAGMAPGDYAFELVAYGQSADPKWRAASQWTGLTVAQPSPIEE